MSLTPGTRLGPYEIIAQIGAGGMGVVYRATDTNLKRAVAIKVLPEALASDAERLARFQQEAEVLASLNHSNIAAIFGLERTDSTTAIVMELVEGPTLAERILQGPIPVDDVLSIARQIAGALETAHGQGIIHRDLKPANIKLRPDGNVKVLDFGLAKNLAGVGQGLSQLLTATIGATRDGVILGTPAYMSPEQARGLPLDQRSDVWAFGCVLYEMLSGHSAFGGKTFSDTVARILEGEPDWKALPRATPRLVRELLGRCLRKDLDYRVRDMAIARHQLDDVSTRLRGRRAIIELPRMVAGIALIAAFSLVVLIVGSMPASREWIAWRLAPWGETNTPAPAAASPVSISSNAVTQEGLTLLRRFDGLKSLEGAIALFERAIAADAAYAPAHAAIARAYTRQAVETRDMTWNRRAVDAARHAVSLDPYLADAHASLGIALVAAGDHQSAEAALHQAEGLDPRNGLVWFTRGEMAYSQDRRADAAAAYQKAIEAMPDDWRSLAGMGTVTYREGKYDDAIRWYTRAAEVAPDVAAAHAFVGSGYVMKGDFASAASALQKSISIRPTATGYTNLGTALFFEGRYQDSVAAFEKGVELRPADPLMWGNLGDAHRWTPGGRERAANAYMRATQLVEQQLSRDATNVRDRSRLALYLSKRGEIGASLRELAKIPDLASRDLNTLYRAAVTYELAGDRSEALRWLGLALERGYNMREVAADPELSALRNDVRYQRLAMGFERRVER